MQYVNLTPHAVRVYADNRIALTIPASGTVARLVEYPEPADDVGGVPVVKVGLGAAVGLPYPQHGVCFVVSMPLLMGLAAQGVRRDDCLYPFGQVRDSEGRIIGCRSLAYLADGAA